MTECRRERIASRKKRVLETGRETLPTRRLGRAVAAAILLLSAALAACDSKPSADGSAGSNGGRTGHIKVGLPF
ncbi:MAG TPA: hypothetical protein VEC75_03540 [Stellaceae bacterium]|nr:hypothetical protein [Stellaceae bacterium]